MADLSAHRDVLIDLNVEYLSWVFAGMSAHFGVPADQVNGMPAAAYVPTVIDKVCGHTPPQGIFYLLRQDGEWVGMGGLRGLGDGLAEIKRLYLRPASRGKGVAARLLTRLLADAQAFGYRRANLDSAPFMAAAQRLYLSHGFTDCAVYDGVEVPAEFRHQWRYMTRVL
jgi:GNAT superfamily N-acetyltransferase